MPLQVQNVTNDDTIVHGFFIPPKKRESVSAYQFWIVNLCKEECGY